MREEIHQFIEELSRVKTNGNFFNQYSYELRANSIRRNNLFLYLQQISALKPHMLLVGEAPGYRGCRLTGVPFTSEYILLTGLEHLNLFGESRGYRKSGEFEKLCKEASASIVWEILGKALQIPLIWNAFPFHPFQAKNEQSNRKPTAVELTLGQVFLLQLIELFDIEIVVAVGNTAEVTLNRMEISCEKVRHPSHGGKSEFSCGINKLLNRKHVS